MVIGAGNYVAKQGELIERYMADHMKYHLDEVDTYREI